jgi:hypothetical protein
MNQKFRRATEVICVLLSVGVIAAAIVYIYPCFRGYVAVRKYERENRIIRELRDQQATMAAVTERLGPPDGVVDVEGGIVWLYGGPSAPDEEPTKWITVQFDAETKRIVAVGKVL